MTVDRSGESRPDLGTQQKSGLSGIQLLVAGRRVQCSRVGRCGARVCVRKIRIKEIIDRRKKGVIDTLCVYQIGGKLVSVIGRLGGIFS